MRPASLLRALFVAVPLALSGGMLFVPSVAHAQGEDQIGRAHV